MDDRDVRVGIIGAGANTRLMHIPGLQALDGVEIVGVCNRSRQSSQNVADEFGIPRVYDDWHEVVADDDTNAVVIGTWPYLHCPATLAAIQADKHVLVEARMAMNADEARSMRDASAASPHLVTQVVPAPMTLGVDEAVRRRLASGELGRLLVVDVRSGGEWIDPDAPLQWRQDELLSGLNVLGLGIWYETIVRWIGQARTVTAMGRIFVPRRSGADGRMCRVEVPDHLDVLAEMECGAQLHIQDSAVTGGGVAGEIFLYGSDGTLRFSDGKLYGARRGQRRLAEIEIPPDECGRWRVEEEFVQAIRGVAPIRLTTFQDGVKYMEFTEAVSLSVAAAKTIWL